MTMTMIYWSMNKITTSTHPEAKTMTPIDAFKELLELGYTEEMAYRLILSWIKGAR